MRPLILRIAARIEMKWSASCRPKPASLSSATCMMSEVLSRERGGYYAWMGDRLAFSHARSICLSRSFPSSRPHLHFSRPFRERWQSQRRPTTVPCVKVPATSIFRQSRYTVTATEDTVSTHTLVSSGQESESKLQLSSIQLVNVQL